MGGPWNRVRIGAWDVPEHLARVPAHRGHLQGRRHPLRWLAHLPPNQRQLLILDGKDPKLVSRRLGHTDVAFTLRTYQHLYADQCDAAVLSFDVTTAPTQHEALN